MGGILWAMVVQGPPSPLIASSSPPRDLMSQGLNQSSKDPLTLKMNLVVMMYPRCQVAGIWLPRTVDTKPQPPKMCFQNILAKRSMHPSNAARLQHILCFNQCCVHEGRRSRPSAKLSVPLLTVTPFRLLFLLFHSSKSHSCDDSMSIGPGHRGSLWR
jgi:hypothetical protein